MKKLKISLARFLFLVAAGSLFSCGSAQKSSRIDGSENDISEISRNLPEEEVRTYQKIQGLYAGGRYGKTIEAAQDFTKKATSTELAARAQNLAGLSYLALGQPDTAASAFRKALLALTQPDFKNPVLFNLATAQFDGNKIEESQSTLEKIDPEYLTPAMKLKYSHLLARVYAKNKRPLDVARTLLASGNVFQDYEQRARSQPENRRGFEKLLSSSLKDIPLTTDLEILLKSYDGTLFADYLLFELGYRAKQTEKFGLAEAYFSKIVEDYPKSKKYGEALAQIRLIRKTPAIDSQTIGVLLPLSGKFAKFGLQSLQAIELAFGIVGSVPPQYLVTLVVEDSGDTPESAVAGLDRLYHDHKVIAVIGPLLSKGIEQVGQRASALGLPLISLTQQHGFPTENVFYTSVTTRDQSYAIARYAVEERQWKKFAILYPEDRFGYEHMNAFWDAVEQLGGVIVGAESFEPHRTDFVEQVDRLTGNYYTEDRKNEVEELRQLRLKENIVTRNRRTDKYFRLPPIVDFDAVFIPDEAKTVSFALPAFSFRDVENIQFLGIPTWNSADLVSRAKETMERAYFSDIFSINSNEPTTIEFVQKYREAFDSKPSLLEALAFDAGKLVETALVSAGNSSSRSDLNDHLKEIQGFRGTTGLLSYSEGKFVRSLKILTVRHGLIGDARETLTQ